MTLKEYNDYISQVGTEYFYDNILTYIEKEIFLNNYLLSWKLYGVNKPINENVYLTIRANERGIYTKVNVYQNDCWGPCEDDDNAITIYYKELIF